MTVCGAPDCGKQLGRENRSGYCRKHFSMCVPMPDRGARISAARKRQLQENPEMMARAREQCRAMAQLPQTRETSRKRCLDMRLWERGLKALTPEVRAVAAKRSAEARMAWCPRELRETYRHLVYSKNYRKAEAKEMILALHEASLAKLRREMGAPDKLVVREVHYFPDRLTEREPGTEIIAERQKAEKARIDALRQRRSLCPICGARSDIGCEHGVAA